MAGKTVTVEFIALEPEEQYDILHYKRDGEEKSGRVYDEASRTQMVGLKPGAPISVTWEKKGNYWNITKVERGTAQGAPTKGKEAPQSKETDWDTIGRQKARCSLVESSCKFHATRKESTPEDVVITAKVFEEYIFSPIPKAGK